jgi:hypothetical protein
MRVRWGLRTRIRFVVGYLLNGLGLPGVVISGDYRAEVPRAVVRVRVYPLFTVVTVNGVDVYFHRLSGRIDGKRRTSTGRPEGSRLASRRTLVCPSMACEDSWVRIWRSDTSATALRRMANSRTRRREQERSITGAIGT